MERTPLPLADDACTSCRRPADEPHDDDCLFAEHQAMLAGDPTATDLHDTDDCYWCASTQPPAFSICRCGDCCRRLIIEVTMEDARREPRIRERASPIKGFTEEIEGYFLNGPGGACVFLDQQTNHCTIYETRPLLCRLFDCDAECRAQSEHETAD